MSCSSQVLQSCQYLGALFSRVCSTLVPAATPPQTPRCSRLCLAHTGLHPPRCTKLVTARRSTEHQPEECWRASPQRPARADKTKMQRWWEAVALHNRGHNTTQAIFCQFPNFSVLPLHSPEPDSEKWQNVTNLSLFASFPNHAGLPLHVFKQVAAPSTYPTKTTLTIYPSSHKLSAIS